MINIIISTTPSMAYSHFSPLFETVQNNFIEALHKQGDTPHNDAMTGSPSANSIYDNYNDYSSQLEKVLLEEAI
ncbi:hypothetical protein [Paenibacillus graminis]|uniref:hypothetical protein n=1 Tax=Paenibacillus graminis TaxID=189425 RepID=UPI002DB601D4|nr:hypothetical protein [Paenibacillus graminis]MEC0168371.1 hypothetical protein [Paenibacillus graminis]